MARHETTGTFKTLYIESTSTQLLTVAKRHQNPLFWASLLHFLQAKGLSENFERESVVRLF
eukprot:4085273-Amphidinium_carterae.1